MKDNRIGFGIFLITIGVLWTLMSIGILNWSIFDAMYRLWPLILVAVGINIMFRNNAVVRIIVWLGLIAALVLYGYFHADRNNIQKAYVDNKVAIEKLDETKNGDLSLELGAMEVNVDSTQGNLLNAELPGKDVSYSSNYNNGHETAVVKFQRNGFSISNHDPVNENFNLNLNKDIIWDTNVKVGATKVDLNLSDLKMRNLNIDCGAGKFDLDFGNKYNETKVRINGGASSFDVNVPRSSGVRIKLKDALTNQNLKDLGWEKSGDYYISPNYDSAENKIDMDINLGLGDFEIQLKD